VAVVEEAVVEERGVGGVVTVTWQVKVEGSWVMVGVGKEVARGREEEVGNRCRRCLTSLSTLGSRVRLKASTRCCCCQRVDQNLRRTLMSRWVTPLLMIQLQEPR
jgi:hypothetical protein